MISKKTIRLTLLGSLLLLALAILALAGLKGSLPSPGVEEVAAALGSERQVTGDRECRDESEQVPAPLSQELVGPEHCARGGW